MKSIIAPFFLCLFLAVLLLPSSIVLSKINPDLISSSNCTIPFDLPEKDSSSESKEPSKGKEIRSAWDDFIENQLLLKIQLLYTHIAFLKDDIFVSSAFTNILSPPPKV